MRQGSKDKGHFGRKAAWLALGALLFIPHMLFYAAAKVDEKIYRIGERMYVWAHPCMYRKGPGRHG